MMVTGTDPAQGPLPGYLPTGPTPTAGYLSELGQSLGRQEMFTRQSPARLGSLRHACPGASGDFIRKTPKAEQEPGRAQCTGRGAGV